MEVGVLLDASNDQERLENLVINVHLSLLIPTDPDTVTSEDFVSLTVKVPLA